MSQADREFTEFVHGSWTPLLRLATALTGDVHAGEDLVQSTLTRVYLHWRKAAIASPHPYTRSALIREYCSSLRRSWRREVPTPPNLVSPGTAGDGADASAERAVVAAALARLPRNQRAVLVLRFLEDLSVDDTAAVLDCSPGTVRSRTNRALTTLRTSNLLAGAAPVSRIKEGQPE